MKAFTDVTQDASRRKYCRTWAQLLLFIMRSAWKEEEAVQPHVTNLLRLVDPISSNPNPQDDVNALTWQEENGAELIRLILYHFTHRMWSSSGASVGFCDQFLVCLALPNGAVIAPSEMSQKCSHLIFLIRSLSLYQFAKILRTSPHFNP
jgi:hypothetical protein